MSKPKPKALHRADNGGKKLYTLLPHMVLESDAHRTASHRARAALEVLLARFNGYNNGRVCLSADELAHGLNCQNHRSNSAAMGELIARGLIALERSWPRGTRRSNEYRLTFISSGPEGKIKFATNEYRHWQEGDAGTQAKRGFGNRKQTTIAATATEGDLSVAAMTTERNRRVVTTATEETRFNGNEPFSEQPSVAATATHISYHVGGVGSSAENRVETPSGPEGGELAELRERVKAHLSIAGVGAQSRLAEAARMPQGTLSKFINGRPLPGDHRMTLQMALYRATVDRKAAA